MVPARRTQQVPIGAKRTIGVAKVLEKKAETQPCTAWTNVAEHEATREENRERIVPQYGSSRLSQQPQPEPSQSSRERRNASGPSFEEHEIPKSDCAFVTVLWGADNPTGNLDVCIQAFVLGYSLKACDKYGRTTSRHARVLLITPDLA